MNDMFIVFVLVLCCMMQFYSLVVAIRDDEDKESCSVASSPKVVTKSKAQQAVRAAKIDARAEMAFVEVAATHQDHEVSAALTSTKVLASASRMTEITQNISLPLVLGAAFVFVLGVAFVVGPLCECCIRYKTFQKSKCCSERKTVRKSGPKRYQHIVKDRVIYEWADTDSTVSFFAIPPPGSEDKLEVTITSDRLKIGRAGKRAFVDNELYATVNAPASNWKVAQEEQGGELEITLKKLNNESWPCIFKKDLRSDAKT